jgi:hypothetical protein
MAPEVLHGEVEPADPLEAVVLPPRRGGRPHSLEFNEQMLRQLHVLGEMQSTLKETAGALGVAHTTLLRFFAAHPEARERWETGQEYGKASVKRSQYLMAHTSPQMAIWFGKQHLAQSDKVESTTTHRQAPPEEIMKRVMELQKRLVGDKAPAVAPKIPQIALKAGKGGDQK